MNSFVSWTTRHPALYLGICFAAGALVRWHMAAGDVGLFLNPFFPLFTH